MAIISPTWEDTMMNRENRIGKECNPYGGQTV